MKLGATFDTGAFIALERRKQRARTVFETLCEEKVVITAPLPVIGEWWRGRTDWRERILASVRVEELTLAMVEARRRGAREPPLAADATTRTGPRLRRCARDGVGSVER